MILHVTYSVIVAAERLEGFGSAFVGSLNSSRRSPDKSPPVSSEEIIISVVGCKVYQIEIWLRAHAVERRCISVSHLAV